MLRAVERACLNRGTEGTEAQVTSQASVCGICGEQSGTSTDFFRVQQNLRYPALHGR